MQDANKKRTKTRGIVILEYLIVGTIVGIGAIAGLAVYNSAVTEEYYDLSEAVQSQNQGYAIPGVQWGSGACSGYANGSHFHEQPESPAGVTWYEGYGAGHNGDSVEDSDGAGTPHEPVGPANLLLFSRVTSGWGEITSNPLPPAVEVSLTVTAGQLNDLVFGLPQYRPVNVGGFPVGGPVTPPLVSPGTISFTSPVGASVWNWRGGPTGVNFTLGWD